ncbi:MAG: glycoside hydrolase family 3 C-terminal domain-containing protein [Phycisphaerales bacterium]|nr:glycoside hydrolase family 3 C-terminal domain-containing protein [Phycisphaerales bacterium]
MSLLSRLVCTCALLLCVTPVFAFDIPGDVDANGYVDAADWSAIQACLGGPQSVASGPCAAADLNGDSFVDLRDFVVLCRNWHASNCQATASSSSEQSGEFSADNVFDGDLESRWASDWADNEWVQLDFGHQRNVHGLQIHWENAYATGYAVDVSLNGSDWSTVFSTSSGDGDVDDIDFTNQPVRYLRVNCTQRATQWGNSIYEIVLKSDDSCYFPQLEGEELIDELVSNMTIEEKTSFVYGETTFSLRPVSRLGIPKFHFADGPLGIRTGQGTAFPASIAWASSWDVDLIHRAGIAMGEEFRNKGRHVWLGPCMNIVRVPHGGRNFETYGEDPYLNSRMAVATITGAQSQGVVACAKHYACNNQEFERYTIDVQVDERALREIYLPAFRAAVTEAGVLSVMSAYNRINGPHATQHAYLQDTILKNEWGFTGFVVSDWDAVHSTVACANNGLDLEMDLASPTGSFWGNGKLLAAVQSNQVSVATIDDKVRRILRAMLFTGIMQEPWDAPDVELVGHRSIAREIAGAGMVLLKNDGNVLPLDKNATQTIAVIGPNYNVARTGGGGSSEVSPYRRVSPIEGLRAQAGPNVTFVERLGVLTSDAQPPAIDSAYMTPPSGSGNGMLAEYFNNTDLQGSPVVSRIDPQIDFEWGSGSPGAGINADNFSARWTGTLRVPTTGIYTFIAASDDGMRLRVDGQLLIDDWNQHATTVNQAVKPLVANQAYQVVMEYFDAGQLANARLAIFNQGSAVADAVAAAQNADTALVFVGLSSAKESEGYDRANYGLDGNQINLIRSVAAVNPKTAVFVVAGSQVITSDWVNDAPAIVQAWYPGQEEGYAIADIVYGDVNPSAKLPMTFTKEWADHPASGNYPGNEYTEGIFVGYRHFDKNNIEPMFCFGHGLSYTTFAYSNLAIDASNIASAGTVQVSLNVENTGARGGAEVVQLYVHDVASSVERPVRELKRFKKVFLAPGQTATVQFELDERALAYYDVANSRWYAEPGDFEIQIGSSSRDIRLTGTFTLPTP